MSYTPQSELREALLSILQDYDLSQSCINELLSDDFISGAFGLIQNEPENDEFMNFARNFSEEQNLSSLIEYQNKISNEFQTEGHLTNIFQFVIDSWRDVNFSVNSLLLMAASNDNEEDITPEDVKKANIITNIAMKILEIPSPAQAVVNEGFLWGKITVAVHNQEKKIWNIMEETIKREEAALRGGIQEKYSTAHEQPSPLIIDLDGDGIVETNKENSSIHFDHDNNGFAESTGWVGKDDGLLVRDLNNNGQIDNGTELFGNNTVLSNGEKAANGFEALKDCA